MKNILDLLYYALLQEIETGADLRLQVPLRLTVRRNFVSLYCYSAHINYHFTLLHGDNKFHFVRMAYMNTFAERITYDSIPRPVKVLIEEHLEQLFYTAFMVQ